MSDRKDRDRRRREEERELRKEKERRDRKEKERRDRKKEEEKRNKKKEDRKREDKKKYDKVSEDKFVMIPQIKNSIDDKEIFMFIYEDIDGVLYNQLSNVEKKEKVTIFPVYISGYNDNLTGEYIEWDGSKYKTTLEQEEQSWLNIIDSRDVDIKINMYKELDQIIVFNDKFFNSKSDLHYYLENYGLEYLPIKL